MPPNDLESKQLRQEDFWSCLEQKHECIEFTVAYVAS